MLERRPLLLGHPSDEDCFCHGFAICTTSLESHFGHAESKSLIPVIPGIFRVPALTGSVTEMAKQMAFGFAMPVFGIFRVTTFSVALRSQNLAQCKIGSLCRLLLESLLPSDSAYHRLNAGCSLA